VVLLYGTKLLLKALPGIIPLPIPPPPPEPPSNPLILSEPPAPPPLALKISFLIVEGMVCEPELSRFI